MTGEGMIGEGMIGEGMTMTGLLSGDQTISSVPSMKSMVKGRVCCYVQQAEAGAM